MHTQTKIVESCRNRPPKHPRNTGPTKGVKAEFDGVPGAVLQMPDERHFLDAAPVGKKAPYWDELSDRHSHHNMPEWSTPCALEGMRLWLDRLDMDEKCIEKLTATSLEEFIELNPAWPLRAWIGLMLEMKAEGQCER